MKHKKEEFVTQQQQLQVSKKNVAVQITKVLQMEDSTYSTPPGTGVFPYVPRLNIFCAA